MPAVTSSIAAARALPGRVWPLRRPWSWLLCAALLAASATAARAQDPAAEPPRWQLWHSDSETGTQVWLRARGDDAPAFRARTRLATRLSALVAVALDSEHLPEWVYRAGQVRQVDDLGPTEGVWQVISHMPWPLSDREVVLHWRLSQDADTGMVTLHGFADPERLPAPEGLVRMPSLASTWRFLPLPEGQVEVLFEGHGEPGGNMALPILRLFVDAAVWHAPLRTVNALRLMVQRPAYRDASLPFIAESPP